jgi:hypothetical protein
MKAESDTTLLGWLSNKPDRLERHLERHPEDIERLERLTALDDEQRAAMGRTLSAPDDIASRVITRMQTDPGLREAGAAFAELFTLGFKTMHVVLGSPDDDRLDTGRNDP